MSHGVEGTSNQLGSEQLPLSWPVGEYEFGYKKTRPGRVERIRPQTQEMRMSNSVHLSPRLST